MSNPTIIIGYGSYGRRLMRLLLSGAAARGVLQWTDPGSTPVRSERRLRSLSLFWTPDPLGQKDQMAQDSGQNDPALEFFEDLYEQIEEISGTRAELARKLTAAVARERDRL